MGYVGDIFQSTLPEWAATDSTVHLAAIGVISIHAARVGSDDGIDRGQMTARISIHAARVGSDSTGGTGGEELNHFNPRCPSGQRLSGSIPDGATLDISIHAARVGSDH